MTNEYENKSLIFNPNLELEGFESVPPGTSKLGFEFPPKSTLGRIVAFDERDNMIAMIKAAPKAEILNILNIYNEALTK